MKTNVEVSGFQHQVGGHFGMFIVEGHVAKPLNKREHAFYEQIKDPIKKFIPEYYGTVTVSVSVDENDGRLRLTGMLSRPDKVTPRAHTQHEAASKVTFRMNNEGCVKAVSGHEAHQWVATCQVKVVQRLLHAGERGSNFVLLSNVVHEMRRPCVLDLKMGTQHRGEDAPEHKKISQARKSAKSTSLALGVRIAGLELYDASVSSYHYIDKRHGLSMDEDQLSLFLLHFVRVAGRIRTAALRAQLAELHATLDEANGYRFFSSSLLIAFDAASPDSPIQIRIIDFAHTSFNGFKGFDGITYQGPDEGTMKGVKSLLKIIPDDESFEDAVNFIGALVVPDLMRSPNSSSVSSCDGSPSLSQLGEYDLSPTADDRL